MSEIQELKGRLPIAQIARQAGVDPGDAERALDVVLPALLGGMRANAQDARGAASLEQALAQHRGTLPERLGDGDVDAADGERIVGHVFGPQTDRVVAALGGAGGGGLGDVVRRILPIVAPIVLAWLAERLFSGGDGDASAPAPGGPTSRAEAPQRTGDDPFANSAGGAGRGSLPTPSGSGRRREPRQPSGGGGLGDLLGGILGGGRGGAGGGDVLGDLLGGLLGGGRR